MIFSIEDGAHNPSSHTGRVCGNFSGCTGVEEGKCVDKDFDVSEELYGTSLV
jgi:hypothetical protein